MHHTYTAKTCVKRVCKHTQTHTVIHDRTLTHTHAFAGHAFKVHLQLCQVTEPAGEGVLPRVNIGLYFTRPSWEELAGLLGAHNGQGYYDAALQKTRSTFEVSIALRAPNDDEISFSDKLIDDSMLVLQPDISYGYPRILQVGDSDVELAALLVNDKLWLQIALAAVN